jgi:hypothetical protein
MSPVKLLKTTLVAGCATLGVLYTASSSLSKPADPGSQPDSAQEATTGRACRDPRKHQLSWNPNTNPRESLA